MTDYWSTTLSWTVGLLLLGSGLGHARHPSGLRLALADRRLQRVAPGLVPLVVAVEVGVGALVLSVNLTDLGSESVAHAAAAVWFLVLALDLVRTRLTFPWASCGCPGADGPIGGVAIARAAALAAAAGWLVLQPPAWSGYQPAEQAVTLLNGASLAVAVALLPLAVRQGSPLSSDQEVR
jgi:hypothetical protein